MPPSRICVTFPKCSGRTDLAVIYPYPHHWPAALVTMAVAFLVIWTGLALWRIREIRIWPSAGSGFWERLFRSSASCKPGCNPWPTVTPICQASGFSFLVVWGANDLLNSQPQKIKIAALAGGAVLAGCLIALQSRSTTGSSDPKLFSRTVEVTQDNYAAEDCLGKALDSIGKNDAPAIYADAVSIEPVIRWRQFDLGMILLEQGDRMKPRTIWPSPPTFAARSGDAV